MSTAELKNLMNVFSPIFEEYVSLCVVRVVLGVFFTKKYSKKRHVVVV